MNTAANLTGANLLGTVNRAIGLAPIVASNGWYQYIFCTRKLYNCNNKFILLLKLQVHMAIIFL